MTTAGAIGSSAHESRTFDCPWCGAISPVPADHLGEHFSCPECRKQTKLTEKNTSSLHVTETPPDAPHLTGDRTFDCPWCGAISSVPSSHLGERFLCPECSRDTKLTSTNTRRAPITAPPPDAPPPATTTGSPRALVAVAVLAVVGVAVWAIASGSSGDEAKPAVIGHLTTTIEHTTPPFSATPPTPTPATPTSAPAGTAPAGTAPPPPPVDAPPPPDTTVPVPATEPNKADEKALADTEWSAAEVAHAAAAAEVITANARVAAFLQTNGDVAEASLRLPALNQALAEVPALAAGASADAIRAYDAAVAQALSKTPARGQAAEAVRVRMASEFHGRGVAGLAWKDLDFHSDAFHRAAAALEEAWGVALSRMPADLVKARDDAERREAEARVRLDRATERRALLSK